MPEFTDPVEGARNWLMRRAFLAVPHEACGFVMKDGTVVEIPNASTDSHNSFAMRSDHLGQRVPNPAEIEALWHTHPSGIHTPSAGDLDMLAICEWRYIIVTKHRIAEYDPKTCAPKDDSFWTAFST